MIIIVIRSLTPHNFSRLSWWWRFQKRTVKKHARRHQRILGDHLRIILLASNSMISSTIVYWKQFNVRMRKITPPSPSTLPLELGSHVKISQNFFLEVCRRLLAPPTLVNTKMTCFYWLKVVVIDFRHEGHWNLKRTCTYFQDIYFLMSHKELKIPLDNSF